MLWSNRCQLKIRSILFLCELFDQLGRVVIAKMMSYWWSHRETFIFQTVCGQNQSDGLADQPTGETKGGNTQILL